MSASTALWLLTWAAIVIVYFGLAAVLREVRLLRALALRDPDGFTAAGPDLDLGAALGTGGPPRLVVAADTGCGLCVAVVERLARRGAAATVLTHEPAPAWAGRAGALPVVSDREAWRAVSHLNPPVLMRVDGAGRVQRLLLPVRAEQVDAVLADWDLMPAGPEGSSDVADVRPDS
jgi:hypothetical protein